MPASTACSKEKPPENPAANESSERANASAAASFPHNVLEPSASAAVSSAQMESRKESPIARNCMTRPCFSFFRRFCTKLRKRLPIPSKNSAVKENALHVKSLKNWQIPAPPTMEANKILLLTSAMIHRERMGIRIPLAAQAAAAASVSAASAGSSRKTMAMKNPPVRQAVTAYARRGNLVQFYSEIR